MILGLNSEIGSDNLSVIGLDVGETEIVGVNKDGVGTWGLFLSIRNPAKMMMSINKYFTLNYLTILFLLQNAIEIGVVKNFFSNQAII